MSGTWIEEWWAQSRADLKSMRLEAEAQDPGIPAYLWLPDGTPTVGPVSFVAAARGRKYPALVNLDKLHRRVLELQGVKPL